MFTVSWMCAIPFSTTLMGPLCQHGKASQPWGRPKVWQASKSDIARLEIGKKRIVLDTSGQLGSEADGIRWTVIVHLPVRERGL